MQKNTTVAVRSRLIRAATPDVLENLFEMQNRLCDLCAQPIQDLIVAALDHSRPVILFARDLSVPIEETIRWANAPGNLRATHAYCNHVKKDKTREEWFALGLDKKVGKPRLYTDSELLELQFRISAPGLASVAAKAMSPEEWSAWSRKLNNLKADEVSEETRAKISDGLRKAWTSVTPEQRSARLRKGWASLTPEARTDRVRKVVEGARSSGFKGAFNGGARVKELGVGICAPDFPGTATHLAGCCIGGNIGGRISGRKHRENGTAIFAPEHRGKGGRATHEKGVGLFAITPECRREISAKVGQKHKENGTGIFSPGAAAKAGRISNHLRWHARRGIVKTDCVFCQQLPKAA
jgi:hypothetical protein